MSVVEPTSINLPGSPTLSRLKKAVSSDTRAACCMLCVTMMRLGDEDSVVAVARSGEKASEDDNSDDAQDGTEHGDSDAAVESQEGDSA